jgi:hypothetical protein
MKFLIWSVVVILILALVNAIASWFGLDVAAAGPRRARAMAITPDHARLTRRSPTLPSLTRTQAAPRESRAAA